MTPTEIKDIRLMIYRGGEMWGVNCIQTINERKASTPVIPASLTLNEAIWAAHGFNAARRMVNSCNRIGIDLDTLPIEVQT